MIYLLRHILLTEESFKLNMQWKPLKIAGTFWNERRTCIGIKALDGIVLAHEKLVQSKLLVPESNNRIQTIDWHIGFVLDVWFRSLLVYLQTLNIWQAEQEKKLKITDPHIICLFLRMYEIINVDDSQKSGWICICIYFILIC